MSDIDFVPTEAVRPRSFRRARRSSDYLATRPALSEHSDERASFGSVRRPASGARLFDLVPEEFRDQFRGFDDDFFQDSVADRARPSSVRSGSIAAPALMSVAQAPVAGVAGAHSGAEPQAPRRPSFFGRLGVRLGQAANWVTTRARRLFGGLFGHRRAAVAQPAPAAAGPLEPDFDYGDADIQRMLPGLARVPRAIDVSRLNPMVPGVAPDVRVAPEHDPYDIVAQGAREQEAAIALMQQHMARQGGARHVARPQPAAGHVSSQSDLDAAFDAMQDDDDAEDLLGGDAGPANAAAPGGHAPAAPAGKQGRSRESFLREGDEMWNNMRDDDEGDAPMLGPSAGSDAFDGSRLSIDVENEGGLEEDLQNIPPDMRDFPGADILYEPQRVRLKH